MKRLMILLFAAALTMTMAMAARADVTDINMYGASAEFNFWSAMAPTWLAASTGAGCTGTISSTPGGKVKPSDLSFHGASYYVATGKDCSLAGGAGHDVTLRLVAFDSIDGIESVLGNTSPYIADVGGCTGNTRTMLYSASGTGTWPGDFSNPLTGNTCFPVTVGASDVEAALLTQSALNVHIDSGSGDLKTISLAAPSTSSLDDYSPIVVPFGLFVNSNVQANGANLTSLTRQQVVELFSGTINNWNQFGTNYAGGRVTLCLRVPGSGTYATFDYGIMEGNGWGGVLQTSERTGTGGTAVRKVFNMTSDEETSCITGTAGAVGFADADKTATGMYQVPYQGALPTRANIRNGVYDGFWTVQHLFQNPAASDYSAKKPIVQNLVNFANLPANSAKPAVYATAAEMLIQKTTPNATTFPTRVAAGSLCVGGTNPGAVCTDDSACTGGGSCTQQTCGNYPNGQCQKSGIACTANSDCGTGGICQTTALGALCP